MYWQLYEPQNILRATYNTIRGKGSRHDVLRMVDQGYIETMQYIWELLQSESYTPSPYTEKTIWDGKERHLKIAPLVPDRIIHHCLIDVLEKYLQHLFINNTYACIKGRGIHKCVTELNKALQSNRKGTMYCLKTDIRHYYDNIDHNVLKGIMADSLGDQRTLKLLSTIVDSTEGKGLPIGFLTSQHLANWYLTPFDHWLKEDERTRYYYRYMDDMVILGGSKEELQGRLSRMRQYVGDNLGLEIKDNWQIFPVDARSIDFCGYKSNHYNILSRQSILATYWRKLHKIERRILKYENISYEEAERLLASNFGWIEHCSPEHVEWIKKQTFKQLFKVTAMAKETLKIGLLSKEVQPTFDCIDRVRGTYLYNHHQQWVEKEEEGKKVKLNQYDSLLVTYPLTRKHVFEELITAKYDANVENKLLNDYNAAVLKLEPAEAKKPYQDFLADRKQLHAMVEADCKANNVPEV